MDNLEPMAPSRGSADLQLEPLFAVALARVQLQIDPLETAILLQAIHRLRGEASSNPDPLSAWTGDLNGVSQLQQQAEFRPLIDTITAQVWSYLAALGFEPSRLALHLQRCWPVVSESEQTIGRHHHPNAQISAVYYLNGDGSGRSGCLRFWPPAPLNELVPGLAVGHGGPIRQESMAAQRWNPGWLEVAPQAGLLLLFPSRLEHAVMANQEEESRFSISLDYGLSAPEPGPAGDERAEYLAPHPSLWQACPPPRYPDAQR